MGCLAGGSGGRVWLADSEGAVKIERPSAQLRLTAVVQGVPPRLFLLTMMAFQLLWLGVIWFTGAATAVYKLPILVIYTLVTGLLITFLPTWFTRKLHQTSHYLVKHEKAALALLAGLIVVAGSFYATQQRLWPFDEEASYEAAVTVAQEGIPGLLRNYNNWGWLATQHPPLSPIIYGQFVRLLGETLFAARLVSLLLSLATSLLTYLIGTDLYDKKTGLLAAWLLFTFPLLVRLSATAMVEPLLVFFFTLTLYLTLLWVRHRTWPYLVIAGVFLGLGLFTKYTMVFVLPIMVGFVLLRGTRKQKIQLAAALTAVGLLCGVAWMLVGSRIEILQTQYETLRHYAGLVMTNEYGRNLLFETITNRLPSALGVYNISFIALGGALLVTRRTRADWLVILWLTAVWLPLLLTLPDHRYFMSSFPAIAILMAAGISLIPKAADRVLLLSILYCAGALYLFVDWSRAAQLFIQ